MPFKREKVFSLENIKVYIFFKRLFVLKNLNYNYQTNQLTTSFFFLLSKSFTQNGR